MHIVRSNHNCRRRSIIGHRRSIMRFRTSQEAIGVCRVRAYNGVAVYKPPRTYKSPMADDKLSAVHKLVV